MVYILHFDPPLKHARHYVGFTERSVLTRINEHLSGHAAGSPLVKAALESGSEVKIGRIFRNGDRELERKIKRGKNTKCCCPLCGGHTVPKT